MYMESRKIILMNLFTEKIWRAEVENGLVDTEGKGKSRTNKETSIDMQCKIDSYWQVAI